MIVRRCKSNFKFEANIYTTTEYIHRYVSCRAHNIIIKKGMKCTCQDIWFRFSRRRSSRDVRASIDNCMWRCPSQTAWCEQLNYEFGSQGRLNTKAKLDDTAVNRRREIRWITGPAAVPADKFSFSPTGRVGPPTTDSACLTHERRGAYQGY